MGGPAPPPEVGAAPDSVGDGVLLNLAKVLPEMQYRKNMRVFYGLYTPSNAYRILVLLLVMVLMWTFQSAFLIRVSNAVEFGVILSLSYDAPGDNGLGEPKVVLINLLNYFLLFLTVFLVAVHVGGYSSWFVETLCFVTVVLLTFVLGRRAAEGSYATYQPPSVADAPLPPPRQVARNPTKSLLTSDDVRSSAEDQQYALSQDIVMQVFTWIVLGHMFFHALRRWVIPRLVRANSSLARGTVTDRRDLGDPELVLSLIRLPSNYTPARRLVACSFNYTVPWYLPRRLPFLVVSSTITWVGEVDEEGHPTGYGEWRDDAWHGEHITGFWHAGKAAGPFHSRETGSASGFANLRVAYFRNRGEELQRAACMPKVTPLQFGIVACEVSTSGAWFRWLPHLCELLQPVDLAEGLQAEREEAAAEGRLAGRAAAALKAGVRAWGKRARRYRRPGGAAAAGDAQELQDKQQAAAERLAAPTMEGDYSRAATLIADGARARSALTVPSYFCARTPLEMRGVGEEEEEEQLRPPASRRVSAVGFGPAKAASFAPAARGAAAPAAVADDGVAGASGALPAVEAAGPHADGSGPGDGEHSGLARTSGGVDSTRLTPPSIVLGGLPGALSGRRSGPGTMPGTMSRPASAHASAPGYANASGNGTAAAADSATLQQASSDRRPQDAAPDSGALSTPLESVATMRRMLLDLASFGRRRPQEPPRQSSSRNTSAAQTEVPLEAASPWPPGAAAISVAVAAGANALEAAGTTAVGAVAAAGGAVAAAGETVVGAFFTGVGKVPRLAKMLMPMNVEPTTSISRHQSREASGLGALPLRGSVGGTSTSVRATHASGAHAVAPSLAPSAAHGSSHHGFGSGVGAMHAQRRAGAHNVAPVPPDHASVDATSMPAADNLGPVGHRAVLSFIRSTQPFVPEGSRGGAESEGNDRSGHPPGGSGNIMHPRHHHQQQPQKQQHSQAHTTTGGAQARQDAPHAASLGRGAKDLLHESHPAAAPPLGDAQAHAGAHSKAGASAVAGQSAPSVVQASAPLPSQPGEETPSGSAPLRTLPEEPPGPLPPPPRARALGDGRPPEALLFVHGLGVDLHKALRHYAQMLALMRFPPHVCPVLFSWPSSVPVAYFMARYRGAEDPNTGLALAAAVRALAADGFAGIHIIVHSMGTRVLMNALPHLEAILGTADGGQSADGACNAEAGDEGEGAAPAQQDHSQPASQQAQPAAGGGSRRRGSAPSARHGAGAAAAAAAAAPRCGMRLRSLTICNPDFGLLPFVSEMGHRLRALCPLVTLYGDTSDGALGLSEFVNALARPFIKHDPPAPAASAQGAPHGPPHPNAGDAAAAAADGGPLAGAPSGRRASALPLHSPRLQPRQWSGKQQRSMERPGVPGVTSSAADPEAAAAGSPDDPIPASPSAPLVPLSPDHVVLAVVDEGPETLAIPSDGPRAAPAPALPPEGPGTAAVSGDADAKKAEKGSGWCLSCAGGGLACCCGLRSRRGVHAGPAAGDPAQGRAPSGGSAASAASLAWWSDRVMDYKRRMQKPLLYNWLEHSLGRRIYQIEDPVTHVPLDIDVIDQSYLSSNVNSMRHTHFSLNREILDDIWEVVVLGRRAAQRSSRLEHVTGNVYSLAVAPTFLSSKNL